MTSQLEKEIVVILCADELTPGRELIKKVMTLRQGNRVMIMPSVADINAVLLELCKRSMLEAWKPSGTKPGYVGGLAAMLDEQKMSTLSYRLTAFGAIEQEQYLDDSAIHSSNQMFCTIKRSAN